MENKEIIETLNTLIEMIKLAREQPDAPVIAAQYTVYGMLGVAIITLLGQLVSTRLLVKSEMHKALVQISAEKESNFHTEWMRRVQDLVTELLVSTDPELAKPGENKERIISCIHNLNLLLNQHNEYHKKLDDAVTALALAVNGWQQNDSIFNLHNRVIQAAKKVIYQPII